MIHTYGGEAPGYIIRAYGGEAPELQVALNGDETPRIYKSLLQRRNTENIQVALTAAKH